MSKTSIILLFCAVHTQVCGQEFKLECPLKGKAGKDYFIVHYMDDGENKQIKDPYCGTKTYYGHKGTDFMIPSFKAMDSGVYVYAAADGSVAFVNDGAYDRSKKPVSGRLGNYISIHHADGYKTDYGHLKKGSLLVKVGDSVHAGQKIAEVGSSGYSAYPHLHFAVRTNEGYIDPFGGKCSVSEESLWASPPPYDTSTFAVEAGYLPYKPGYDSLLERYLQRDIFYTSSDTTICFWVLVHGLRRGDKLLSKWYNPKGVLWFSWTNTWDANPWWNHTWTWIDMPVQKGVWTTRFYVNGKELTSRIFVVRRR